jgi:hypothetical protein
MRKLKEIQLTAKKYRGMYDDMEIEFAEAILPEDSVILKASYSYTNYLGHHELACLYLTSDPIETKLNHLQLFRLNQNISDSFEYLNISKMIINLSIMYFYEKNKIDFYFDLK